MRLKWRRLVLSLRVRLGCLRSIHTLSEATRLVQAICVAAWVPLLMRLPLPVLARVMERRARAGSAPTHEPARLAETVEIAQVVAWPLVRSGCVTRAVTLYWLLAPGRPDMRLCFGIGGETVGFAGHCWLERGGEPLLERVDPRGAFREQFSVPIRRFATVARDP